MKKVILSLVMSVMLVSNANAGILILTGDIGNKFEGYKTVGWLVTIFTGLTIVGLVIDGEDQVNNMTKLELSESSLDLLSEAVEDQTFDMPNGVEATITVGEDVASEIVALEGLTGTMKGTQLFNALTK
mgnify:CR=1 FL=1